VSHPADSPDVRRGRSGPAYAAAKGGVIALTRWVAKDLGQSGIYVNSVAPGSVETEMTRDVFLRIAGFDERFTQYGNEDVELSLRLGAAGVPIVYEPSAVATQRYDKDFAALADDETAKGRTAVQLGRLHPEVRSQLKLGSWREQPFVRRLFVGALLAATRLVPAMRRAVVRVMTTLGDRRRALALRMYPPVLDYLYWCGVREAERGTASGAT